ncbi:MAG: hypothetical protein GEV28_11425 [Actinophytocola sp.]|uniref:hypothetical protein n=1 Tax=Actinophytocola sp. TaxID=1872138 RepID=UPI001320FD88|nr:hypothetical protein [Actinophytocola sp.]MPZ80967.1 hypothetical protein [Actinophytocola sp.]
MGGEHTSPPALIAAVPLVVRPPVSCLVLPAVDDQTPAALVVPRLVANARLDFPTGIGLSGERPGAEKSSTRTTGSRRGSGVRDQLVHLVRVGAQPAAGHPPSPPARDPLAALADRCPTVVQYRPPGVVLSWHDQLCMAGAIRGE